MPYIALVMRTECSAGFTASQGTNFNSLTLIKARFKII